MKKFKQLFLTISLNTTQCVIFLSSFHLPAKWSPSINYSYTLSGTAILPALSLCDSFCFYNLFQCSYYFLSPQPIFFYVALFISIASIALDIAFWLCFGDTYGWPQHAWLALFLIMKYSAIFGIFWSLKYPEIIYLSLSWGRIWILVDSLIGFLLNNRYDEQNPQHDFTKISYLMEGITFAQVVFFVLINMSINISQLLIWVCPILVALHLIKMILGVIELSLYQLSRYNRFPGQGHRLGSE